MRPGPHPQVDLVKIAYVVTRSDQMSGPQVHIRDLASALAMRGHQVAVLAGGSGLFFEELKRRRIPCHALRHMVAPIRPDRDPRALFELVSVLREIRPALLSTHSTKAGILGRLAGRMLGIPTVHTAHGWAFTDGIAPRRARVYRLVERSVVPLTARIITVSEYDRRLAIQRRVAPSSKPVTVHNGVPDVRSALRAEPGRRPARLITVARLERQKDHPSLFRALSGLVSSEWTLDVVGDGPERSALEALTEEVGIGDRVQFLGARNDVAELLASSQVFLLISKWEGFPRSILEAMRAGLPVVATDVAGVRESVLHAESGFLIPRGDDDLVRQRIAELIADPTLARRMGDAGRRRYEEHFTFDAMLEKTCAIYEDALGRPLVA